MIENTDRVQLAALSVGEIAIETVEGAAAAALYTLATRIGLPEPVATVAVRAAIAEFHKAHKRAMAPTVTAPGLEGNLREG